MGREGLGHLFCWYTVRQWWWRGQVSSSLVMEAPLAGSPAGRCWELLQEGRLSLFLQSAWWFCTFSPPFNISLPARTGQRGLCYLQLRVLTHRGGCRDDTITPLGGKWRKRCKNTERLEGEDPDQEIHRLLLRGLQPTYMSPGSSLCSPLAP